MDEKQGKHARGLGVLRLRPREGGVFVHVRHVPQFPHDGDGHIRAGLGELSDTMLLLLIADRACREAAASGDLAAAYGYVSSLGSAVRMMKSMKGVVALSVAEQETKQ